MCEIAFEAFAFKGSESFALLEYLPSLAFEDADISGYSRSPNREGNV